MTTDICYFRVPWSYEKDLNTKICTDTCACRMRLGLCFALWHEFGTMAVLRSQRHVMTTDICYFRAPWSYEKDLNTKICTDACACQMHHGLCVALWHAFGTMVVLRSPRHVMTTDICYFRAPWSYEKDLDTKICTDACACQMRHGSCVALWRALGIVVVL